MNIDILFNIFTFLPFYYVCSACRSVCHQWNDVTHERRFKLFAIFQRNHYVSTRTRKKLKKRKKAQHHESLVPNFDTQHEIEYLFSRIGIPNWDIKDISDIFVPSDYKIPPLGFAVRMKESDIKSRYWRCAALNVPELFPECDWTRVKNLRHNYDHCLEFFLQDPDDVLTLSPEELPSKLINLFDGDAEAAYLARRVFFKRRGQKSCRHFKGCLESIDGKYYDEEYDFDYDDKIKDIYQLRMCDFEYLVRNYWSDDDIDQLLRNMITNRRFSKIAKEASSETFGGCNPALNTRAPLLVHILPPLPNKHNDPLLNKVDQQNREKTYQEFGAVVAQQIFNDLGHIDAVKFLIAEAIDAPLFRTRFNTVKNWNKILQLSWTTGNLQQIADTFKDIVDKGEIEDVFSLDTDYHFGSQARCEAFVAGKHRHSGRVVGFGCIFINGA